MITELATIFGFVDLTHPLMMTFGLAMLIPILIHYWHRQSHLPIKWAATKYLQLAMQKVGRRISFFQWLLLALRILLILVLTISLTSPGIRSLHGFLPGADETTRLKIIVVDATLSMGATEQNRTRMENAKQIASQLVEQSSESDSFVVFIYDQEIAPLFAMPVASKNQVLAAIDSIDSTQKSGRLKRCIGELANRFDANEKKSFDVNELHWISDFNPAEWGNTDPEREKKWTELSEQFELVRRHSVANSQLSNNFVSQLRAAPAVSIVGQSSTVDVLVENRGGSTKQNLTVELLVNNQILASKLVEVEPEGQASVRFDPKLDRVGEQLVEVRIDEDCLPADNRRYLTMTTRRQYQVLFVEERVGSSRFLQIALDPSPSATSRFQTRVCSPASLSRIDLANIDFVFCDNVGRLTRSDIDRLKRYVKSGRPLVFFLGDLVDRVQFNELWNESEGESSIDLELTQLQPVDNYQIDPLAYQSRFLESFRGNPQAGLTALPIWCYFQTDLGRHPAWKAELALTNGDPLLISRNYGAGALILFTSSSSSDSRKTDESGASVSWNANEAAPVFPALIQELFARSLELQANLVQRVGEVWSGSVESSKRISRSSMIALDGREVEFELTQSDGIATWRSEPINQAGFYRFQGRAGATELNQSVAVNVDTRESDLQLPTSVENIALSSEQDDWISGNEPGRRTQLFQWILASVTLLLVAEMAAAFRFGRGNG